MRRKIVVPNNKLLEDVATMIASGEQVILLTKGQSMLPFIVGGRDSVELTPIADDILVGDILLAKTYSPQTSYVIHRVIKVDEEFITLMGDGNLVGTEQALRESVVARVTAIIKPNQQRVDPYSKRQRRYTSIWQKLHPIRRYILAILRRILH